MSTTEIHNQSIGSVNLTQTCPICKQEFKVRRPSEIGQRKYCSKQCQVDATKKEKVEIACEVCGKKVLMPPCLASTTKFCSRKCKGIAHRKFADPSIRQCYKCKKILEANDNNFYPTKYKHKLEYRCISCQKERGYIASRSPGGRFIFAKHLAKRRQYEWNIPREDYYKLIEMACHYCGFPINETGVGLDRKDNSKGYTIDNVVTCCKDCNTTRSDHYTYEEMLVLAPVIQMIKLKRVANENNDIHSCHTDGPSVTCPGVSIDDPGRT